MRSQDEHPAFPDDARPGELRHAGDGYLLAQKAGRGETLRPEPFVEIELRVGVLFGDDPED